MLPDGVIVRNEQLKRCSLIDLLLTEQKWTSYIARAAQVLGISQSRVQSLENGFEDLEPGDFGGSDPDLYALGAQLRKECMTLFVPAVRAFARSTRPIDASTVTL